MAPSTAMPSRLSDEPVFFGSDDVNQGLVFCRSDQPQTEDFLT
jgi:hypothetical protein